MFQQHHRRIYQHQFFILQCIMAVLIIDLIGHVRGSGKFSTLIIRPVAVYHDPKIGWKLRQLGLSSKSYIAISCKKKIVSERS